MANAHIPKHGFSSAGDDGRKMRIDSHFRVIPMTAFLFVLFISLLIPDKSIGQYFPPAIQCVLHNYYKQSQVSCNVIYTVEYPGLRTPLVIPMEFDWKNGAFKYQLDMVGGGDEITKSIGKKLALVQANRQIVVYDFEKKLYSTVLPDMHVYYEQAVDGKQQDLTSDSVKWEKAVVSDEKTDGFTQRKHLVSYTWAGKNREEAIVWVSTDGSNLPVKIEIETSDAMNQRHKATIIFTNYHKFIAGEAFGVPTGFRRIKDSREILSLAESADADQKKHSAATAVTSSKEATFFKEFLADPQNVKIVFSRYDAVSKVNDMFVAKWQKNGLYLRQVNTLDEISVLDQDPRKLIFSVHDGKYAVIINQQLIKSESFKRNSQSQAQTIDIYAKSANNIATEPLKMGILFAEFGTFQWNGNAFEAADRHGGVIKGNLTLDSKGRPAYVTYSREKDKIVYQVDYSYEKQSKTMFPDEINLGYASTPGFVDVKTASPYKTYKTLDLTLFDDPMPAGEFLVDAFTSNVTAQIVYSNNQTFFLRQGKLIPVSKATSAVASSKVRYFVLILIFLGLVPLGIMVVKNKQITKQ